jgi:AmmeMemoRadiSam system protein B
VAGRFYPSDARELSRAVDEFAPPAPTKFTACACLVPHAGYVFSGHVAGAVYGAIEIPRRIILIGPRHYPAGADMAINSAGSWRTPLNDVPIDGSLAESLKRACPALREDETAHLREHSLEVQLPFLQRARPDFRFVPVVLGTNRWSDLENLGLALASVIAAQPDPVLLIASSDMNHYEPDDVSRVKDKLAIDKFLAIDAHGLYDVVRRETITMCGYAAAVSTLIAANKLGASRAGLIRYATSGDINGDRNEVVGYAGIVVAQPSVTSSPDSSAEGDSGS